MRRLVSVVLVIGCGARGAAPAATPEPATRCEVGTAEDEEVEPAPLTACPTGEPLDALAKRLWEIDAPVSNVTCLRLRLMWDRPWFWVAGQADLREAELYSTIEAVTSADGDVLWLEALHAPGDYSFIAEQSDHTVVDLDGDGDDEVIYIETAGEGGGAGLTLVVFDFDGDRGNHFRADYGSYGEDTECRGSWAARPGGVLEVTFESPYCDPPGRHVDVYRFKDGVLTEVTP